MTEAKENRHGWETLSSKVAFKGRSLTVMQDIVVLPSGASIHYEYVHKSDSVLIIPATNNSYFFVEQFRYPVKKRMLEFPQGAIKDGEPKQIAAIRELLEETGFITQNVEYLGRVDMGKSSSTQGCHIFLANNLIQGSSQLDETEQDVVISEVPKSRVIELIRANVITDNATLAAYSLIISQDKK